MTLNLDKATSVEIDFMLVRQKDNILSLISDKKFSEARACLAVVLELWQETSYLYKFDEILRRINLEEKQYEEKLVARFKNLTKGGDIEAAHAKADDFLCRLIAVRHPKVVQAFEELNKWCA